MWKWSCQIDGSSQVFKEEVGVGDGNWDSVVCASWNWMFHLRMEVRRWMKTESRETPAFKGGSCPGVCQLRAFQTKLFLSVALTDYSVVHCSRFAGLHHQITV